MIILPNSKIIFPGTRDVIDLESKEQIDAVKRAFEKREKIIFTPDFSEASNKEDIIGTVIAVEQILSPFAEVCKVLFSAVKQVIVNIEAEMAEGVFIGTSLRNFELKNTDTEQIKLLGEKVGQLFTKYVAESDSNSTYSVIPNLDDNITLNTGLIANYIECRLDVIYREEDAEKRLLILCADLETQIELLVLEKEIDVRVKESAEQNQKEFYIREQIRMLSEELGEDDECEFYLEKIDKSNLPADIKEKLARDVHRMRNMSIGSPEMAIIKNYLDVVFDLPLDILTKDNEDLDFAREILDADHYGMAKVKDRLIEALAVRLLTKNGKSPILCLVGPAGVGKTSVAKSIANAMNKKYVRVSFGGVRDEAEIRGHRKTYIGSMPGRIITGVTAAGSMNPVFLMDEIDKMAADYRGDPASALLEVLDPEQNKNFRDHYLEIPFDLSEVLFITTANSLETISRPLLDRMEIIEMSGYTFDEKKEIAKRHLVKKAKAENGIEDQWIDISDGAIETIIESYTRESGVRGLSKQLSKIMRRIAIIFVKDAEHDTVTVTAENLKEYLGKPLFEGYLREKEDIIGAVTGLAWTEVGGETLPVEVCAIGGKGDIILTGSLGDVMKESARIGLSYLRAAGYADRLPEDYFKTHDIHVHAPEGATPKDGPSAGITMATAFVSLFQQRPVRADTAMTGEITLLGNVLPIGGLKEKSLAALRSGVKRVILPEGNRKDYDELPESVKENMEFCFVKRFDEVYRLALRG